MSESAQDYVYNVVVKENSAQEPVMSQEQLLAAEAAIAKYQIKQK